MGVAAVQQLYAVGKIVRLNAWMVTFGASDVLL